MSQTTANATTIVGIFITDKQLDKFRTREKGEVILEPRYNPRTGERVEDQRVETDPVTYYTFDGVNYGDDNVESDPGYGISLGNDVADGLVTWFEKLMKDKKIASQAVCTEEDFSGVVLGWSIGSVEAFETYTPAGVSQGCSFKQLEKITEKVNRLKELAASYLDLNITKIESGIYTIASLYD